MKKSISIILLSLVLLFAAYDRYFITDNNKLNELYIKVIEKTNDSLKIELKELREFKKYGISIGDTTIQATTNLKIQG